MAIEIQAPHEWPSGKYTVFLAGVIDMGSAPDWQRQIVTALADYDVVLLNPRRDDWDSSWEAQVDNPQFVQQVAWESRGLEEADFRVFVVFEDSKAPVTMLEVGKHLEDPGCLMVEDGFYREGNLEFEAISHSMPVETTMGALITRLKVLLDEKGLRIAKKAKLLERSAKTSASGVADPEVRVAKITETSAFKSWFRNSLVVDASGNPLVVYRGEHGSSDEDFHSRSPSLSFGDAETANLYAENPNNRAEKPVNSRVLPCYLRIEKPIINDPEDPFIDLSVITDALGIAMAHKVALQYDNYIIETGKWEEHFAAEYDYVQDLLEAKPEAVNDLYLLAFPVLDNVERVNALKTKGYDGAIHAGYGANSGEAEYKIFDHSQAKSAVGNAGTFDAENVSITASKTWHLFNRPVTATVAVYPTVKKLNQPEAVTPKRADGPTQDQDHMGKPGDITENPKFKAWFKGSKVVDDHGRPMRVFHGTLSDFDTFDTDEGTIEGATFFTPDPDIASTFADIEELGLGFEDGSRNVMACYLRVLNPAMVQASEVTDEHGGHSFQAMRNAVSSARKAGHDGMHILDVPDGNGISDQWAVFRPNQIKSAIGNNGDFDPKSNSITASRTPNLLEPKTTALDAEDFANKEAAKSPWLGLALAPMLLSPPKTTPQPKAQAPAHTDQVKIQPQPRSFKQTIDDLPKDYRSDDLIDRSKGDHFDLKDKVRDLKIDMEDKARWVTDGGVEEELKKEWREGKEDDWESPVKKSKLLQPKISSIEAKEYKVTGALPSHHAFNYSLDGNQVGTGSITGSVLHDIVVDQSHAGEGIEARILEDLIERGARNASVSGSQVGYDAALLLGHGFEKDESPNGYSIPVKYPEGVLPPKNRPQILVVVHPGSACGSADFHYGSRRIAQSERDGLIFEFNGWTDGVIVIDGDLSDELPDYPNLQQALDGLVARAKASGLVAERRFGPDPDQMKVIRQVVKDNKWASTDVRFVCTGAWAYEDSEGCVGSVYQVLKRMKFLVEISDNALTGEDRLSHPEDRNRYASLRKDAATTTFLQAKSKIAAEELYHGAAAGNCTCGHSWAEHHHMADFGCKHESEGCGCVGWTDKKSKAARSRLLQKVALPSQNKINTMMKTYGLTEDQINACIACDPSPNQTDFVSWIAKQLSAGEIRLPEDESKIKSQLTTFTKLKRSPAFTGEKDIQRYTPDTLYDLIESQGPKPEVSKKQQDRDLLEKGAPGAKLILNDGNYKVFEVTDPALLMVLSSNTNWCTSQESYAKQYLEDGPNYVFYVKGEPFAQVDPDSDQFMNRKDGSMAKPYLRNKVAIDILTKLRGIRPDLYTTYVLDPETAKQSAAGAYKYALNVIKGRWPEAEKTIASDPQWASYYAQNVIKGRWPEAEKAIASDPQWANYYALNVIKGRWPEGEKAIASDPKWAYYYAQYVIKGRWPEGEKAIASNPKLAYHYALNVIKGRWPEAEKTIASDPELAYHYALSVIKGRWPEGEKAIASDPELASYYAQNVIKGRWPEAEKAIASDPELAHRYAQNVIKGRWPEAEKAIASDPELASYYAQNVIKGRWPEAEKAIASDPQWANYYALNVIKGRWPEAEKAIASDPELAYHYAQNVIKGRWPEAEKAIASDPKWANYYAQYVIKGRWPEGEKAIASDPKWANYYAQNVIKGRWPDKKEKHAKFAGAEPKVASPEDIEHLKSYLNMTDEEKGEELARSFHYFFLEFIQNEHPDLIEFLPEDEDEYTEDFTPFSSVLPQFLGEYGPRAMQEDPAMTPSFLHMSYKGDVDNEWLIHFTDNADAIAKSGFQIGVSDISLLGLTTYHSNEGYKKKYGGYNFGFELSGSHYFEPGRYGKHAVVFQASGIRVWHDGDQEDQIIFWGKDAKNIVAVNDTADGWVVKDRSGKDLKEDDDIREVAEWIEKNWKLCLGVAKAPVRRKDKLPVAAKLLQPKRAGEPREAYLAWLQESRPIDSLPATR